METAIISTTDWTNHWTNHWTLQIIMCVILCIVVLVVGHYLWNILLKTFSQRRTRDLVNLQTQRYKTIIEELSGELESGTQPGSPICSVDPHVEELMMQMDLEQYMDLLGEPTNN